MAVLPQMSHPGPPKGQDHCPGEPGGVRRHFSFNDFQLWKLLEGREVKSGLGEEALEEAGPVLHPPEPGLDQRGQLIDVVLGEVGQR